MNLDFPTHVCPCGCQMWRLQWVIFDDYEIAAHSIYMECIECGTTAITPTLADKPEE